MSVEIGSMMEGDATASHAATTLTSQRCNDKECTWTSSIDATTTPVSTSWRATQRKARARACQWYHASPQEGGQTVLPANMGLVAGQKNARCIARSKEPCEHLPQRGDTPRTTLSMRSTRADPAPRCKTKSHRRRPGFATAAAWT